MSTIPSQIATLDGLCYQMRAHVPPLGEALTALLPELRAVDRLGLIAGRSRLGIDAENLARDAADLLVLREMGIRNDDTGAAEEALLTLIADMRVRISELIKGRTASLRINTEVSAAHADPDADTVDLTDGYRLMAAHPTPRDAAADGLVITDLGLPETGGKVGRITGKIRGGYLPQEGETYKDGAGPLNTFYLPAGRSVRLAPGEQVRVHACGKIFIGADEALENFSQTPVHYEVQAVGDDVQIHGPATFSVSRAEDLGKVFGAIEALKDAQIAPPDLIDTDPIQMLMTFLVLVSMGAGVVSIGAFVAGDYWASVPAAAFAVAAPSWRLRRAWSFSKKWARIPSATRDVLTRFGAANLKFPSKRMIIEAFTKGFVENEGFSFYPLRKVIASETKGVQEIRPLAALPAPSRPQVRGLYGQERIPDRRLFRLDLDNVAEGLDLLADLRGAGVEDDRILSGLSDVRALAENMSARAKRLVDDKVSTTLIHTSTASLGLSKSPVAANLPAPMPDDLTAASAGEHATLTRFILDGEVGGRISGDVLWAELAKENRSAHAVEQPFFLREGRVLVVGADEAIILREGAEGEETFDVLRKTAFRVEPATGPIEVHGPVFVSQAVHAEPILRRNGGFALTPPPAPEERSSASAAEGVMGILGGGCLVFLSAMITMMRNFLAGEDAAAASPTGLLGAEMSEILSAMLGILPVFAFLAGIFLTIAGVMRIKDIEENDTHKVVVEEGEISRWFRERKNRKVAKAAACHGLLPRGTVPANTMDGPTVLLEGVMLGDAGHGRTEVLVSTGNLEDAVTAMQTRGEAAFFKGERGNLG